MKISHVRLDLQKTVNTHPTDARKNGGFVWGPHLWKGMLVLFGGAMFAFGRWYAMSDPRHFSTWLPAQWFLGETRSLTRAALNLCCCLVFLVFAPLAVSMFKLLQKREHNTWGESLIHLWGIGLPRFFGSRRLKVIWLGLLCGALVVAGTAVWSFSAIRETYPVYRKALSGEWVDVTLALLLTGGLILTTELFYRGVMLFAGEKWFGKMAVYAVLPIYVLDHIGAPPVEVAASVVTGAVLGHLALETRSLWPGFIIHAACALTVDVGSIWVTGG